MKVFIDKKKPKNSDRLPIAGEEILSVDEYVEYARNNNVPWGIVYRTIYIDLLMSYEDVDKFKRIYDHGR